MNTQYIDCKYTENLVNPGDFCYDSEFSTIYIILPGCRHPDAIDIQKGEQGGPRVWGWDGNIEQPTLTPSIHDVGHWHGYLKNGRLESC